MPPPRDLAGARFRERVDEFDAPRYLVGRNVLPAPIDDGLRFDPVTPFGARYDDRLDRLAPMRVLGADDASFLHRRMLIHERLDLGGPYLVPGGIDHALEAIDDEKRAVLIHPAKIAAAEESLAAH